MELSPLGQIPAVPYWGLSDDGRAYDEDRVLPAQRCRNIS